MNRRDRRAAGQTSQTAAGADSGQSLATPAALCELARGHLTAGKTLDAQLCCQQALAADPACAEAMHLMGELSLRSEQLDHAVEWFSRAARQDMKPLYLIGLGDALKRQGRHEEACQAFDQAAAFDNNAIDAWKPLAQLLADLGRRDEAAFAFRHVLKLDPADADAAYQAGFLAFLSGKPEEALGLLARAEQLRGDHAPTLQMRALVLQQLGRHDEAGAGMSRAHALDPGNADICNDMGAVMLRLGRQEEALSWFDRALTRRPDFALAQSNKLHALLRLHRFDEALAIYAAQKAANPDDPAPDWNAALIRLRLGDFEAGWIGREARWKVTIVPPSFPTPMWLGETPIAGKTILIFQDEGLGDAIQFARYVPMLAVRGARVILGVGDPLVPLLSKLPGVAACVPRSADEHLSFDVYCAIGSLPLVFETRLQTIPSAVPYLPAPDQARIEAWQRRLGPHDRLRVGLVWSGNPKFKDDLARSVSFSALAPLVALDATFVSLQKEPRPDDQAALRARPDVIDWTAELTDFAETAALMSCLDLVISVDTATAHLAGALARPVWILLPYTPDWRWLLGRDDSPWYPTARLFRQSQTRDYTDVIARVRAELQARIASRSPNRAAAPAPLSAAALFFNAALAQARSGLLVEARRSCEQVLALDPAHAETLHLLGVLALSERQFDAAVDWMSRAIRCDAKPLYLASLGTALLGQERREEAVQAFDRAVQLKPDDAELWRHLGGALVEAARPADAIVAFQQALKLDPNYLEVARGLSLLLFQAERYEDALAHFNLSAALSPDHFPTHYMRALTLEKLGRLEEALADHARAHALDPGNPDACYNMGNVLRLLHRHREALDWYDKALALRPDFAAGLSNRAVVLAELRRFDEAILSYRAAITADSQHAVAEWNLALLQLLLGDFESGWRGQEARWKVPAMASRAPTLPEPKWLGAEPVAGKTVLVWANEGLGDAIQFVRYVPMLAARGARVVLVVPDPLCALLSGVEGVAHCLPTSAGKWPERDYHVPLSSLPLAFGTRLDTIPAKPYLPAPPAARAAAWNAWLGAHDRLRVGLVWSGNINHNNDRNRSLPLRALAPVLELDARFVSLQKDPRPDDAAVLREHGEIADLTADLGDFTDTAALLPCLDLVIAVDTSVAHLSAALSRPTWILLPFTPDWRWLLDRGDSPWYPSARLFRQDERRDYAGVIARVRAELAKTIAAWPGTEIPGSGPSDRP